MSSPTDPNGAFQRSHPSEGMQALEKERKLPLTGWQQEVDQAKRLGLEAAESIVDRNISTFSRGELPHFAGINTFMKTPYCEDVRKVGGYEAAFVGVPFDTGTTYRPGTRFGPQAVRRISAVYDGYSVEG
ncbi:MAG: arginase family protein, partial [Cyanobacteria bacterium]|nr:arginase family protein [Cyanobacteriota bacterium]